MSAEPDRPAALGVEARLWLFQRVAGVLLVPLLLGQLFVTAIWAGGAQRVSFATVAGRWSSPVWQCWDLVTMWLALLYGALELRGIITDYARRDAARIAWKVVLYTLTGLVLAVGTLVILTFDPTR